MYFKYKTVSEVKTHLNSYLNETIAKIEMWKRVEVKKKKNGEEFAKLGQALVNARLGHYYPVEDLFHPYLTISYCANGRYSDDHLEVFYYMDELSEDKQARETIYRPSCLRPTSPFNAYEIRQAIFKHIETLEKHKKSLEKQIASADVMFNKFRDAIAKAEDELTAADLELRDIGAIYPTSLFYAITSMN